jgi:GWxTD domain-containing protein
MKFLEIWVATPLAQTIGWTIIHSLWQGAVVSAGLAAALTTLRSSRARYAAACTAMLVLLVAIVLTFARVMPQGMHARAPLLLPFPAWNVQTAADYAGPSSSGLAALVPWLTPFWMLGVWIFGFGQVAGWMSVSRLRRQGVCSAPEFWQAELARLRGQLRVSRPVLLLESCLADVPVVVGHIRPAMLMPVGVLTGLPANQVEAILLHELAHVRRGDYLVNVLQRSVQSLLFYHPAVWWISRLICTERENCCDDVAVAICGDAHEYAKALTTLEQNRWPNREPVVAATGGNLVNRVRRLLYPNAPNGIWTPLFAAIILLSTAMAALAAWPPATTRPDSAPAEQQKGRTAISPYDKWLNEDVVYIISAKERAAFEKLTTNEERDKFIEQFWERRNPHPGSPTNTFKQEHYRRMAYANQHFASTKPGWQTDRGHIYIVYGPPDEIDSHPAAKPGGYEQWMYHHAQGHPADWIVTFVDKSGKGDYHLAPPQKSSSPS